MLTEWILWYVNEVVKKKNQRWASYLVQNKAQWLSLVVIPSFPWLDLRCRQT